MWNSACLVEMGRAARILPDSAPVETVINQWHAWISTGFFHLINETLLTGVSSQNGQNEHAYGISFALNNTHVIDFAMKQGGFSGYGVQGFV